MLMMDAGDPSFGDNRETRNLVGSPTKIEKEASERQVKLGKGHDIAMAQIIQCARNGNKYLDLTGKNLTEIPEELLGLPHVEYLYLEGNELRTLPETFFQKLPQLRYLDLRNNKLLGLPSAFIGSHKHLKYLLVQGNSMKNLPLELGEVSTLQGLSLSDNPIEFPPASIVNQGLKAIREYLHEVLLAKTRGRLHQANGDGFQNIGDSDQNGYNLNSDDEETFGSRTSTKQRQRSRDLRLSSAKSDKSEVMGKTVSFHRQQSYQEIRQDKMKKLKQAGASGKLDRKSSQTKIKDVNLFPAPPSVDLIDERVKEQQIRAIKKEKNEKIEVILQRRKDEDRLKLFREDAKHMQRRKDQEKYMNGGIVDYTEPTRTAPFDYDEEYMRVINNEERIKNGVKENHERIRKVLSPRAIHAKEMEEAQQDRELTDKIKDHTQSMKSRRKKPKGTPQEEMLAAVKELEIAKRLQTELDRRRRDMNFKTKPFHIPT